MIFVGIRTKNPTMSIVMDKIKRISDLGTPIATCLI
jgi:hypothetical protein